MADTLPATSPKPSLVPVRQEHRQLATAVWAKIEKLKSLPLTQQTRSVAVEIDTHCQKLQKAVDLVAADWTKPAYDRWKQLVHGFQLMREPYDLARRTCSTIVGKIDAAEREKRRLEALERARIESERLLAEKRREVDEMVAHAAASNDPALLEAAERIEAEPVMATVVKPDEYKPVDSTYSTSRVPVVEEILDKRKLLEWLLEGLKLEAMSDIIEFKEGRMNGYLRKGVKFPEDAVKVGYEDRSMNRGKGDT